jgi:hypothetical protein
MQAWNTVKVINEESGFHGQAGLVTRVEREGENQLVFVKIDTDGTVQPFAPTELQLLG